MDIHSTYMRRCLELAAEAAAQGESPVGSIVVKDGIILGEAFEQSRRLKDITRHAEVLAIMDALQKQGSCVGATLYSNVEPCILCSYVIRHHRLAEVVFAKTCGELGGMGPHGILIAADIHSWGPPPVVVHLENK